MDSINAASLTPLMCRRRGAQLIIVLDMKISMYHALRRTQAEAAPVTCFE